MATVLSALHVHPATAVSTTPAFSDTMPQPARPGRWLAKLVLVNLLLLALFIGLSLLSLFQELSRMESQYGPVALTIVDLAVNGRQEEAITKMNADCRPLLAALIKATNDYIALSTAQAKADEAGYEADRALLVTLCVLALGAATGLALLITRGLTRALGAEPTELGAAARRVARATSAPSTVHSKPHAAA